MNKNPNQPTLLIIDDEQDIAVLLSTVLKREGFEDVHMASTAKEGLDAFKRLMPDLVLLDIMLPDGNGYDLFSEFQQIKKVPILFVSAKDEEIDRLLGFALGAEDYITKPFSPKEVAYRVKARLKWSMGEVQTPIQDKKIHFGVFCIDPDAGEVRKAGKLLDFTAKELKLLFYLAQNSNRILSKEMICTAVWGEDFIGFDNTISVHIRKIRLKIEDDPSNPKWIQTVIGLGYKFVAKGDVR
jgi:DNA-binding response OmpR family regulator